MHKIDFNFNTSPGRISHSVARLTEVSKVLGSLRSPATFMEMDHDIVSTVISPLSPIQEGQFQFLVKVWALSIVCLDLSQPNFEFNDRSEVEVINIDLESQQTLNTKKIAVKCYSYIIFESCSKWDKYAHSEFL